MSREKMLELVLLLVIKLHFSNAHTVRSSNEEFFNNNFARIGNQEMADFLFKFSENCDFDAVIEELNSVEFEQLKEIISCKPAL